MNSQNLYDLNFNIETFRGPYAVTFTPSMIQLCGKMKAVTKVIYDVISAFIHGFEARTLENLCY